MRRPNILLITTDQQRADHLGCAGLRGIATPNLDRLAADGLHACRAYTTAPLCTPARVSLLTGQYPSRHGAYTIGVSAEPFPRPLFLDSLRSGGYHTALIGKTHFVRREDEERHMGADGPDDRQFFRHWHGPYLGFDHLEGSKNHNINGVPFMHYRSWLEEQAVDYSAWFPRLGGAHPGICGPWQIPEAYHDTSWVAERAAAYITTRADADQPWLCWASIQDPHEPFVCPEPWFSRVDTAAMPTLAGYQPEEFDDRHACYRRCFDNPEQDYEVDGLRVPCCFGHRERDAQAATCMQATLGMIGLIDHAVGRLLAALAASGQDRDTIVVFTSDHGEMHGHHGLWGKGLPAYEDAQRVPLIARGPGIVPQTSDALTSLVDLPRTLLALAGLPAPVGMQGVEQSAVWRGEELSAREEVLVECRATPGGPHQQSLITADRKLVVYAECEDGELYELDRDPDQYRNRWSDPDWATARSDLLHRLACYHMRHQGVVAERPSFA